MWNKVTFKCFQFWSNGYYVVAVYFRERCSNEVVELTFKSDAAVEKMAKATLEWLTECKCIKAKDGLWMLTYAEKCKLVKFLLNEEFDGVIRRILQKLKD